MEGTRFRVPNNVPNKYISDLTAKERGAGFTYRKLIDPNFKIAGRTSNEVGLIRSNKLTREINDNIRLLGNIPDHIDRFGNVISGNDQREFLRNDLKERLHLAFRNKNFSEFDEGMRIVKAYRYEIQQGMQLMESTIPSFETILNKSIERTTNLPLPQRTIIYNGILADLPRETHVWRQYINFITELTNRGFNLVVEATNNLDQHVVYSFNSDNFLENLRRLDPDAPGRYSDSILVDENINAYEAINFNLPITISIVQRSPRRRRDGAHLAEYIRRDDVEIPDYVERLLSRYQIETSDNIDDTSINKHCLVISLCLAYGNDIKHDMISKIIHTIIPYIKMGHVNTKYFKEIAEKLGVTIHLHIANNNYRVDKYNSGNRILNIGLIYNHYFVYEELPSLQWAQIGFSKSLDSRSTVGNSMKFMLNLDNCIYVRKATAEELYLRDIVTKPNDNTVFTPNFAPLDIIYDGTNLHDCCQHLFDMDTNGTEVTYRYKSNINVPMCKGVNTMHVQHEHDPDESDPIYISMVDKLMFLDLETFKMDTYEGDYKPVIDYSASLYYTIKRKGLKRTWFTKKNVSATSEAIEFGITEYNQRLDELVRSNIDTFRKYYKLPNGSINELKSKYKAKYPVTFAAHNAKFDVGVILRSKKMIKIEDMIGEPSNIKSIDIKWQVNEKFSTRIRIIDTYSLIPIPLSEFGKTFGLESNKAPYPYSFYNEIFCTRMIHEEWVNRWVPMDDFCTSKEMKTEIIRLLYKANKIPRIYNPQTDMINTYTYCEYYNELDVEVQAQGVYKFWNLIMEATGVNVEGKLTIGSCAKKIVEKYGALKYLTELEGVLSEFVRTHLRGGMVLLRNNLPKVVRSKILPLDVNSLYPFCQTKGLPAGLPFYVNTSLFTSDNIHLLNRLPCYMGTFIIHTIPKYPNKRSGKKPISYIPYKDDTGSGYKYLQEMPDGINHISLMGTKQTFKLLTRHQGLKYGTREEGGHFIITSALGFAGKDKSLARITEHLYDQRAKAKLEKNEPLSFILKLLLNNIWGKFAQRTFNDTVKSFRSEQEALSYVYKNADILCYYKEIKTDSGPLFVINSLKNRKPNYVSRSHVAMHVLEHSKLTIAEHIETLEHVGMKVIYADTDSAHATEVSNAKIDLYRATYRVIYGRDPMAVGKTGDILGNMKIDFKIPDGLVPKNEKIINICGDMGMFYGAKMYLERVLVTTDNMNNYHFSVAKGKGITQTAIMEKAKEPQFYDDNINTRLANLYEYMITGPKGEKVTFDMLAGDKISIKSTIGGNYYRKEFKRDIECLSVATIGTD